MQPRNVFERRRLYTKFARSLCGAALVLVASSNLATAIEFKILHIFTSQSRAGWAPSGELTMDAGGALYGTTGQGGAACPAAQYSCGGTVYRLEPPAQGDGAWAHSVLYSFRGGRDGSYPSGGIILRPDTGIMFGTTQYGGVPACSEEPHGWGCGTAFELVPPATSGGKWGESIIVPFPGGDKGAFPAPRWLQLEDGRLLGATTGGGTSHAGTMVVLAPKTTAAAAGPSRIVFSVKYVYQFFPLSNKGSRPVTFLSPRTDFSPLPCVSIVGTGCKNDSMITQFDGDENCRCGAITAPLRPGPNAPDWSTADVYQFRGGANGAFPNYGIVGPDGALYGTARGGIDCPAVTSNGCGIVYKYTPAIKTQKATYEVLHRFKGGADGALPIGRLQVDGNGHVFGVTQLGGNGCTSDSRGCGALYELIPPVPPAKVWTVRIQHRFVTQPTGGLLAANNAYYGVDDSDVFRFTP